MYITGEHIDYMGYGVMPMAIANNVRAVVLPVANDNRLVINNVNGDKYKYVVCVCVLKYMSCIDRTMVTVTMSTLIAHGCYGITISYVAIVAC